MGDLFSPDGLLYKLLNHLYVFFFANVLWIIFSLPIFTIGASTTALFNVMDKLIHDKDVRIFKDFWKSYKLNFKQGSIIGTIFTLLFFVLYLDLSHLYLFHNTVAEFSIGASQIFILLELMICSTYVFYMLSKYDMTYKKLFFNAFVIGNRHLLTSILCITVVLGIVIVYSKISSSRGFILCTFASLYSYGASFFIKNIITRYVSNDERNTKPIDTFKLS